MSRDSQAYLRWLIMNSSKIALDVEERIDIKSVLSQYTNLKVTMTFNQNKYFGYGIAPSEDLALIKASVEAFERMISVEHGVVGTTNGIAAHFNYSDAEKAASLELIERDDFFYYYFSKKKLNELSFPDCDELSKEYKLINSYCHDQKLKLNTYIMRENSFFTTAITIIRDLDGALVLSLGVGDNRQSAILSSSLQCFRKALAVFAKEYRSRLLSATHDKMALGPVEHLNIGLSSGYFNDFIQHFSDVKVPENDLFLEGISTSSLKPHSDYLRDLVREAGIICSRATSPFSQSLFFGKVTEEIFNSRKFSRLGISFHDVKNFIPHAMA